MLILAGASTRSEMLVEALTVGRLATTLLLLEDLGIDVDSCVLASGDLLIEQPVLVIFADLTLLEQ